MRRGDAFERILREVGRAFVALSPYGDKIILVGGIVPVLYRRMPAFRVPPHPPLATTEADLAIPPRLPVVGGKGLVDLLFAAGFVLYEAPGFKPTEKGKQFFQDSAYGAERPAPTYLEFLTPLRGKPTEGFLQPQLGVRASPLRYLDLLSHEPMTLDARNVAELEVAAPCAVRIPHPSLYVVQKVLARTSGRSAAKQPKDMAYAYDIAMLTQPIQRELGAVIASARAVKPEWKKWIDRGVQDLRRLFATETSDGTIEAARIYRDAVGRGGPSESAISRIVREFADALFSA